MANKVRLAIIVVLLVLSVLVDSVYYIISAVTDGALMAAVIWLAYPMAKQLLKSDT